MNKAKTINKTSKIVIAEPESIIAEEIASPIGTLLAAVSSKGLCLLEFADVEDRLKRHVNQLEKNMETRISFGESALIQQLKNQLTEYFNGKRKTFDIALDFHGTEFQTNAWDALLKIPYGETRSYKDQAIAIHKPTAVRAVAGANNRNKISIVIPCHRVIGKNGSMTGYGGELWRKEFLLKLEKAI